MSYSPPNGHEVDFVIKYYNIPQSDDVIFNITNTITEIIPSDSVIYAIYSNDLTSESYVINYIGAENIDSYSFIYDSFSNNIDSFSLIRKPVEYEYNNINVLMRIDVYRSPDSKRTIYNSLTTSDFDNRVVGGDVIRDVTDSLSSASFVIDNTDGENTYLLNGGEFVDVYVDYEDRRLTVDLYDGLEFFMGEDNGSMVNKVDE